MLAPPSLSQSCTYVPSGRPHQVAKRTYGLQDVGAEQRCYRLKVDLTVDRLAIEYLRLRVAALQSDTQTSL